MPATHRFSAYLVTRDDRGACHGEVRTNLSLDQLPPGGLLIRVDWSSINYKDALSATGNPGVTKQYPHIPGIDATGTVVAADSGPFAPGDPVIVTGHRFGMDHWGGFAQYHPGPGRVGGAAPGGPEPAGEHAPGHRRLHRGAGCGGHRDHGAPARPAPRPRHRRHRGRGHGRRRHPGQAGLPGDRAHPQGGRARPPAPAGGPGRC